MRLDIDVPAKLVRFPFEQFTVVILLLPDKVSDVRAGYDVPQSKVPLNELLPKLRLPKLRLPLTSILARALPLRFNDVISEAFFAVNVVSLLVLENETDVRGVLSRWSSLRALRLCPFGLNEVRVVLLLRLRDWSTLLAQKEFP